MTKEILLVDDEKDQLIILKKVLTSYGYLIETANSYQTAMDKLSKKKFPLVFTDLSMPESDGLKLCRDIRKTYKNIIIYALSGFIPVYSEEKLEQLGFDGYLAKPVETKILKQAIEGAFDKINRKNKQ
jgi:CheY-like chemotaxis protein